ncbi:MAG: WxcM-like domain-containing protein [bacterium]
MEKINLMNKNMINGVVIKQLNKFEDDRGWLAEIFRYDELNFKPAMSYVSITQPGKTRGPHEHKEQSDFFVFLGPGDFELYLWDNRSEKNAAGQIAGRDALQCVSTIAEHVKITVGEKNPVAVIVPPGVVHGYKCISDHPAMCINLPDKLYRGEGKKEEVDEIRWEKMEDSPFKID